MYPDLSSNRKRDEGPNHPFVKARRRKLWFSASCSQHVYGKACQRLRRKRLLDAPASLFQVLEPDGDWLPVICGFKTGCGVVIPISDVRLREVQLIKSFASDVKAETRVSAQVYGRA